MEQGYHSIDRERLVRVTIYEPGVKKEQVKVNNKFAKKHAVLIGNGDKFKFKGELG